MGDGVRSAFGDFLRSRRERLRPEDMGLPVGRSRRTAGLRRQEVAERAGIGIDWYIRLEQGRAVSPSPATLAALANGITIDGVRYGGIEAALDSRKGDNCWLTMSLREGRNREIRRVIQHLGYRVSRLIRIAYGPFQLGLLERGAVEEVPGKVLREQLPHIT